MIVMLDIKSISYGDAYKILKNIRPQDVEGIEMVDDYYCREVDEAFNAHGISKDLLIDYLKKAVDEEDMYLIKSNKE